MLLWICKDLKAVLGPLYGLSLKKRYLLFLNIKRNRYLPSYNMFMTRRMTLLPMITMTSSFHMLLRIKRK